jgi:hypothetical protein
MKKIILSLASILLVSVLFAQAPQRVNYQAVARNNAGVPLINTAINIGFEILEGSSVGPVAYSETQNGTITTNQFGLFTAQIGAGNVVSGTFPGIAWASNSYFLRITINGGVMPATQLLSVPYALHAGTATSGVAGDDGINCWDTNNDGFNDPSEDVNLDGSWNALDCKGDSGVAGTSGANGTNGIGIDWLGDLAADPPTPTLNQAYYNTTDGESYIWDGLAWQTVAQDGTSSTYVAGNGISIVGNTITATKDTSITNELQTLSVTSGATPEIILSNGGNSVKLVGAGGTILSTSANEIIINSTAVGDNWGADTVVTSGVNISGQGTTANPLIVTDNDNDPTNELELPLTGNTIGDVIKWNGTTWVAANDSVIDGDNNSFNELNTGFSINGNNLSVSDTSNTFTAPIATPAPTTTGQVLTWDNTNNRWEAQNPGSGADNWGTQVVQVDGTTIIGDGNGTPLSGFDGQYSSLTGAPTIPTYTGGTDITVTTGNVINNDSPDQTVILLGGVGTTVTGTYPSFTINSTDNVNDADSNATNELVTSFGINGANLELIDGGGTYNVALSSIALASKWAGGSGLLYPTVLTDKVGIGTNAPDNAYLHTVIDNLSGYSAFKFGHANQPTAEWYFDVNASGVFTLFNENFGSPVNVLNSNNLGNIGIGVTAPSAKLHLDGTLRLDNLSGTAPAIGSVLTSMDANGNAEWQPPATPTSFWSSTNAGSIHPTTLSNYIGIGTANPQNLLHVQGAAAITYAQFTNNATGQTANDGLKVGVNGLGAAFITYGEAQDFKIQTNGGINALWIVSNGNVGVGTVAAPTEKLDVNGNITSDDYLYNTPKTHYQSFSWGAFRSFLPQTYLFGQPSAVSKYGQFVTGGSAFGYANSQVNLPDGAVITELRAWIWDNGATNPVRVRLFRQTLGLASSTMLANVESATAIALASVQDLSTAFSSTVDNQTYSYHLEFTGAQNSADTRLYGVRITYTITKTD